MLCFGVACGEDEPLLVRRNKQTSPLASCESYASSEAIIKFLQGLLAVGRPTAFLFWWLRYPPAGSCHGDSFWIGTTINCACCVRNPPVAHYSTSPLAVVGGCLCEETGRSSRFTSSFGVKAVSAGNASRPFCDQEVGHFSDKQQHTSTCH